MLLPILDQGEGKTAFNIFKDVENYLKNSDWCFYKSNSDILNILQDFRKNLNKGLRNKEVLKLVAEKTRAGSLIRIHIENLVSGIKLNLDVIGSSGEDVYFRKKEDINIRNTIDIIQTIKQWLSMYAQEIPYDGHVTGVLGDQFTIDIGNSYGFSQGDEIIVKRLLSKRQHPLFKEVIDWSNEVIAKGKIIHSTQTQSQGKIFQYDSKKKIQIGDWINIVRQKKKDNIDNLYLKNNDYKFGRLGYLQILLSLGQGLAQANKDGKTTKKINGFNFGADVKTELWVVRNIFTSLTLGKNFGNYKKRTEKTQNNSLEESHFSFVVGYKYLPLGFFYGPQVNSYIGYAINTYSFDAQEKDGFTEFLFKGFLLGVQGDIPLSTNVRGSIELGLIFRPNFEEDEDIDIYGKSSSSSHTFIALGGDYAYTPNFALKMLLGTSTSEAKFLTPSRLIKIQKTFFRLGTVYNF